LREELPAAEAMPVVIEPGDLLAFSGQHLHGSVATDVSATRFSIESRTVSLSHIREGLSAPNVDGKAPRVVPDWFEHVVSGERLAMEILSNT
jgi:ectoine hydroxylase-related dioxygenase (phytanoyl-CoA dioxygenase family)